MGTLTPEERHFFRSEVHARDSGKRLRPPRGHVTEAPRQVPVHDTADVLVPKLAEAIAAKG